MENPITIDCEGGLQLELTTVPFEPVEQFRLLAQVGKVLVPTVLAARGVTGKSAQLDLMPAAKALFDSLAPDFAVESMLHVLRGTVAVRRMPDADPERIDLVNQKAVNRAFKGTGIKTMLLALKHALEVNYGTFSVGADPIESTEKAPSP